MNAKRKQLLKDMAQWNIDFCTKMRGIFGPGAEEPGVRERLMLRNAAQIGVDQNMLALQIIELLVPSAADMRSRSKEEQVQLDTLENLYKLRDDRSEEKNG
ncbi:MAG: hypothetical protein ABFE02_17340 [Sulfuricella sp.]